MRAPVDLPKAYRLLNHGPTVLVSAAHKGHSNVMAAAWVMPVDFNPPKVAIVIDKNTYTHELLHASGEFALSVPCRALLNETHRVGSHSGRGLTGEGKFDTFGLQSFKGSVIGAPLVEGCVAWLECKLLREPEIAQRHDLFIGEVLAAQADTRVFSAGRWHFGAGDDSLRTLHHIAGGAFFTIGEAVQAEA